MRFILQVDLIVAVVSLFTIVMLWFLNVSVPRALVIVFVISVLLIVVSIVIDQIIKFMDRK